LQKDKEKSNKLFTDFGMPYTRIERVTLLGTIAIMTAKTTGRRVAKR
jgi:hypothetical protein